MAVYGLAALVSALSLARHRRGGRGRVSGQWLALGPADQELDVQRLESDPAGDLDSTLRVGRGKPVECFRLTRITYTCEGTEVRGGPRWAGLRRIEGAVT
jgi:hypothetical protein